MFVNIFNEYIILIYLFKLSDVSTDSIDSKQPTFVKNVKFLNLFFTLDYLIIYQYVKSNKKTYHLSDYAVISRQR